MRSLTRLARPLGLVLALGLGSGAAPASAAPDGLAGPYLAGRLASFDYDYTAAAQYFARALAADPGDPGLMENLIIGRIGTGEVDAALPIAKALEASGKPSQIAEVVILAGLAREGDFQGLLAALDQGHSAGGLADGLLRGWADLGLGRMSEATEAFDAVVATEGLRSFGLYHKALALALVGDYEGADAILSGAADGPLRATRRGVIAHAQILSQLERQADAVELLDKLFGQTDDAQLNELRARLAAKETVPFDIVTDARDGIAEVFYSIASALNGDEPDLNTLTFARMAEFLAPKRADTLLLCASILEAQGQHELASRSYSRIGRDDPAFVTAELGRSDALIAAGNWDAAIEVLRQLSKDYPERSDIWAAYGDALRRQERFAEAADAYDRAVALFAAEEPRQWVVYYTRGIARERLKRWPEAEANFRKALDLSPDQPAVLNYLGYSYLDRKDETKYDEALAMIERAVAARPDDGAITDSLGWALYLLGRYDEAVTQLERAVELMPVDPVINDHLGDAYWAVGRRLEAQFQWRRALSFKPESEAEAARIRRKLEVGLDAVLAEEGAPPLAVTRNGD
ncbi:tetratricopeptide repeat protein [Albidovulum sp.]